MARAIVSFVNVRCRSLFGSVAKGELNNEDTDVTGTKSDGPSGIEGISIDGLL